ncbi:MAG: FlgD immunoglobulin-like domain containing protein [Planctomycetota bacterium]|jgi:sugar lactone lactonase YvrE
MANLWTRALGLGLGCLTLCGVGLALDETNGEMTAVPVPKGKAVTLDGKLDDWDLSGKEWFTISDVIADRFSGDVAVMYDDDALYIAGEILTSGGPLLNTNKPDEKPWMGHDVEFRCVVDPDLPYPLKLANLDKDNPDNHPGKIKTITLWQETLTQTPNMLITDGPPYGNKLVNPDGAKVIFKEYKSPDRYIMEARITWKTLGVPGGKNPFKTGDAMTAHWTVVWPQNTSQRASFLETASTGSFGWAWWSLPRWGRIHFSGKNNLPPRHGTLADYLKKSAEGKGTAFDIDLPSEKKVSVSIVNKGGRIIRELIGGEKRPAGTSKVYWDGYDWMGNPMPKGEYSWRAYAHDGLTVKFMGAAGTSAKIPWETKDGKGNWGAIGLPPMDVAADKSGTCFLWSGTEGGKVLVKIDKQGDILWRVTPNTPRYGTYGPFVACAANSKYVYVVAGWRNNEIVRMHADTGLYAPFSEKEGFLVLSNVLPEVPKVGTFLPVAHTVDIEVTETEIFVPLFYDNKVAVYDAETGKKLREAAVKFPRGVCLTPDGTLHILSKKQKDRWQANVFRWRKGQKVVDKRSVGIGIPHGEVWDLEADKDGRFYVSESGLSHRIWVYNKSWVHVGWIGEQGGRPFGGRYNNRLLRDPAGLSVDDEGNLYVAQASSPIVFQKYAIGKPQVPAGMTLKDLKHDQFPIGENTLVQEWFGDVGYCPATWPDAKDPLLVYTAGFAGLIRAKLKGDGTSGGVEAYWNFGKMGYPEEFDHFGLGYRTPKCVIGPRGVQYMYCMPMGGAVAILKVRDDVLTPMGYIKPSRGRLRTIATAPGLEVWADTNHDGQVSEDELIIVNELAGESLGDKLDSRAQWSMGPVHIDEQGNLYFSDSRNRAYRVPIAKVDRQGVLSWDWSAAKCLVKEIVPFKKSQHIEYSPRKGIFGIDVDARSNLYFTFTEGSRGFNYASKEWTEGLSLGLGHTGGKAMVKWSKFNARGEREWIAGRKATGVARPGEVYHHWGQGGVLGQGYLVGASEWNTQAVYSPDGFFVDTLFSDPNKGEDPGPYSIGGGETFSGKSVWFPKRGEAYLYTGNSHGMAYRLDGFDKSGRVKGEIRFSGTMTLAKHVNPFPPKEDRLPEPTVMGPLTNPFASGKWGKPVAQILDNNGEKLAKLTLGYDAANLYARFEVRDTTPMDNRAELLAHLFKKGDAVGLYLGSAKKHDTMQKGDVRILATEVAGKPVLQAMVPQSTKHKKPFRYQSPVGDDTYAYVGPVPGGDIKIEKKPNSYVVSLKLPKAFFEGLDFGAGRSLGFEAEVLLSGFGQRGFQAMSRNHIYTSRANSMAKMVDDIPSEARLYPASWGILKVK